MNRQFDQTYGLKGYPTVVMIPGGYKDKAIYYTYDGSRTAERIEEWAIEKMKDAKGFMVPRITSDEVWKEYCIGLERPLCVIVFLPNILDSSPEERAVHLQMIKETINNFRDKPISFMWAQANDHPEVEEQFSLQSGFPAVLLISTRFVYARPQQTRLLDHEELLHRGELRDIHQGLSGQTRRRSRNVRLV